MPLRPAVGLLALLLTGCVASDQGLCPPGGGAEAVFDPALLGDWHVLNDDPKGPPDGMKIDSGGKSIRIIRPDDAAKTYRMGVPITGNEPAPPDPGPEETYLVPLGDARFLDIRIVDPKDKTAAHLFARLDLDRDDLTLTFMDPGYFANHPGALPDTTPGSFNIQFTARSGLKPEFSGEPPRLHAATADLRKFIAAHARDAELWPPGWSIRCRRVPPEPTPAPPKPRPTPKADRSGATRSTCGPNLASKIVPPATFDFNIR